MATISGVGSGSESVFVASAPSGSLSVAAGLRMLKLRPTTTVDIADTAENIQRNLDALQGVAGRIGSLSATGATQQLSVSAADYQRNRAALAKWGAGDGNTVEVTGVAASAAAALVAAKPAWVSSITVSDTASNLQRNIDALQSLASGGSLRQIVQTGPATALRLTLAQFQGSQDALGRIRNQAYRLAITDATVSDTLGLDGNPALTANDRIQSIAVRDTTAAIEANLDALQRVGLRLKSVSQTDTGDPLTISASQYARDAVVIGKILTPFQLEVLNANATQASRIASDRRVVTLTVQDTAANLQRRWGLMQRLAGSLDGVQVSDPTTAITLTGDQLALSQDLLAKFGNPSGYRLSVTGVSAGMAAAVAATDGVTGVTVSDSAANVAAHLDELQGVAGGGELQGVVLTGRSRTLALQVSQVTGAGGIAAKTVLDTIRGSGYGISVDGVGTSALADVAANASVVSIRVDASASDIAGNLDALYRLGKRLGGITQSDAGTAISLTQAGFDARGSVLGKIDGGYRVDLTAVTAARALSLASNANVGRLTVADSSRNLSAQWTALRTVSGVLDSVTPTDAGTLSLSAAAYLGARTDGLLARFAASQRFAVTGASITDAAGIAADSAVERVEVAADGAEVSQRLSEVDALRTGGKLGAIALTPGASLLSLRASQLDGAQGVLALVKGGRYTLSVSEVAVGDAATLAANAKVSRIQAQGDAAGIVANLDALAGIGTRLRGIDRTDTLATPLALDGSAFEQRSTTLDKISGGYLADLSAVGAAKAQTLAASPRVRTLQVTDTAAGLSSAWSAMDAIGSKLTAVTQTDAGPIQLTAGQWSTGATLAAKFAAPPSVSVSEATVADLGRLSADSQVTRIQVRDASATLSAAWATLAAEPRITALDLTDPTTPLEMSAATATASATLLGSINGGRYQLALGEVPVSQVATLLDDTHVASLDVLAAGADISSGFDALQAAETAGKLGDVALSDTSPAIALTAAQVLSGSDTLARISDPYSIAATDVALADLDALQAIPEVGSFAIADTAANVADNLATLTALGSKLSGITLTDDTPVLALTEQDRTDAAGVLATIGSSYQMDISEARAASVATLAADSQVRRIGVSDSAANVGANWDALVAAYADGAGPLNDLLLSDEGTLQLTQAQRDAGASMIAALLPQATLDIVG